MNPLGLDILIQSIDHQTCAKKCSPLASCVKKGKIVPARGNSRFGMSAVWLHEAFVNAIILKVKLTIGRMGSDIRGRR